MCIIVGILLSFALFFIYDINDVRWKLRALHRFFGIGCIILFLTTLYALGSDMTGVELHRPHFWIGSFIFIISITLLVYTLFFALPLKDTYVDYMDFEERRVCDWGVYAFCRHPGVWCMAVAFLGLFVALPGNNTGILFGLSTFCNVVYVWFQDVWTFPRTFQNYGEYQKHTPFLLPDHDSIVKGMKDFKNRKDLKGRKDLRGGQKR